MTITATDKNFKQLIATGKVLVDFWAPWCGPCKSISPLLDALASTHGDSISVVKVDVDTTTIASEYKIRGIPTLILFEDGIPVKTQVGAITKAKLFEFVGVELQA